MQRTATVFVLSLVSLIAPAPVGANGNELTPQVGTWRAWLDSPGGELAFQLTMTQRDGGWRARLDNGNERIDLPNVRLAGATIEFDGIEWFYGEPDQEAAETAKALLKEVYGQEPDEENDDEETEEGEGADD